MSEITKNKKNVLFLASWYPNEDQPLQGIFIRNHAEAISQFCNITVFSIHHSNHRETTALESAVERGVTTVRLYYKKPPFTNRILKYAFRTIFQNIFLSWIRCHNRIYPEKKKPDLIHINVILPMGIFALCSSFFSDIPVVLTEHSGPFSMHTNTLSKNIACQIILKKVRKIFPVSTHLKEAIQSYYPHRQKYSVIPNAIDMELFRVETRHPPGQKKRFLHISLLDDGVKNISGIMRSVHILYNRRQDFEFRIVGEGKDRSNLERLAESLGLLNTCVFFEGFVPHEQIPEILSEADCFVINSFHETFSMVCAESLAAGTPVIATRCGGPEEYINDSVGILIDQDNSAELANAMDCILDNPLRYSPEILHEYAEKKFGYQEVGRQFYSEYTKVLSKIRRSDSPDNPRI